MAKSESGGQNEVSGLSLKCLPLLWRFLAAASFTSASAFFGVQSACAAEIETFLVESHKRPKALANTPLSATVFSADQMSSLASPELRDLLERTPNIGVNKRIGRDNLDISVRGIGTLGGELQSTGIYLDGFELRSPAGRLFDIEQIEVLRGPQGSAFGRNVTAGAINQVVADANVDSVAATVSITAANFETLDVEASANIPLSETVAVRLSGYFNRGDAPISNIALANDASQFEDFSLRAVFSLKPNDLLRIRVIASHETLRDDLTDVVPDGVLTGSVPLIKSIMDNGLGRLPPGTLPAAPGSFFPGQNSIVAMDMTNVLRVRTSRISTNLNRQFDTFEMDFIAGYSRERRHQQLDLDASIFDVATGAETRLEEFWSTEVRFVFEPSRWGAWVAGLYYGHERSDTDLNQSTGTDAERITFLPAVVTGAPFDFSLLPNNTEFFGGATGESLRSLAAYALVEHPITQALTFSAGLRLSNDLVKEDIANAVDLVELPGGLLSITPLPDGQASVETTRLTGSVSLFYAASEDAGLYARMSTGYRTGGLQLNRTVQSFYGDETVRAFELGTKLALFERRLRLDVSGFYTQWRDIQILTINRVNNQSFTDNAAKARAFGFEVDAKAQLANFARLNIALGHTNSALKGFADIDDPRDGSTLPNAPKWKLGVGLDLEHDISIESKAFLTVNYVYNGNQIAVLPAPGLDAPLTLDRWHRLDVRAGIKISSRWRLEAYANNALGTIYADGGTVSGLSLVGSGFSSPRRVYGVRATFSAV